LRPKGIFRNWDVGLGLKVVTGTFAIVNVIGGEKNENGPLTAILIRFFPEACYLRGLWQREGKAWVGCLALD
jgi:hypothetical protein